MMGTSWRELRPFPTKAAAPAAREASRYTGISLLECMTTTVCGHDCLMRRMASKPSIPGSVISSTIRSGRSLPHKLSASSAQPAANNRQRGNPVETRSMTVCRTPA